MSRPTRAGGVGRNVTIRAATDEQLLWRAAAQLRGKTLSDWIRPLLNKAAGREIDAQARKQGAER